MNSSPAKKPKQGDTQATGRDSDDDINMDNAPKRGSGGSADEVPTVASTPVESGVGSDQGKSKAVLGAKDDNKNKDERKAFKDLDEEGVQQWFQATFPSKWANETTRKQFQQCNLDGASLLAIIEQNKDADLKAHFGIFLWPAITAKITEHIKNETTSGGQAGSLVDLFIAGVGFTKDNGVQPTDPLKIDRKVVDFIVDTVRPKGNEKQSLLIRSPPGSGKTALLQQLLARLKLEFPSVHLVNGLKVSKHNASHQIVEVERQLELLPPKTVVVFDEAQRLYESLNWESLLKTGAPNVSAVIAAATYGIDAKYTESPADFSVKIGLYEMGMTDTEKSRMAALVYQDRKPTVFSPDLYDKVVGAVGHMTRVRGDEDVYHFGLFRLLLLQVVDSFTEREKKHLQSMIEWHPTIKDVSKYLRSIDLAYSDAIKRTYASAAQTTSGDPSPANQDLMVAVRTFFMRGSKPFEPVKTSFESKASVPTKKPKLEESRNGLHLLIRSGAVTTIERKDEKPRFVWSTLVAEQFFFMRAFPSHQLPLHSKPPATVKDFVLGCLPNLDGHRMASMRGRTSVDGHLIETVIQECVYSVFSARTPRDWELCPERRIGDGRIDFQVNGWGIEFLVEGHKLNEHIEKASQEGKYASPDLQQFLVANFYTQSLPSASETAVVEASLGVKADSCYYLSVVFAQDFEKATVYVLNRATKLWEESEVRLNQPYS